MICDQILYSTQYDALAPRIHKALAYLRNTDFSQLEDGKYTIDGNNIFMRIRTKCTKLPNLAKSEVHKKYLDIQYIIPGFEYIGYCSISRAKLLENHPKRDIAFHEGPMDYLKLGVSSFMLLFPQDVHALRIALETPGIVRKVVVKILA